MSAFGDKADMPNKRVNVANDPKRTWAPRGVTQGTVYSRLSDILLAPGVALMAMEQREFIKQLVA